MPFMNYPAREMICKVVYYGPGLCGKTTNLQVIAKRTSADSAGRLVSLNTSEDRTLFFDFFPFDLGDINGFKIRMQLYTVPGQIYYGQVRQLVLKGVDGVVFVADSQVARLDANMESFEDLKTNLAERGYSLDKIPYVIQYNKRDMKHVAPVEELRQLLNPNGVPDFEAIASQGVGVFETLKAVSKLVLTDLKRGGKK